MSYRKTLVPLQLVPNQVEVDRWQPENGKIEFGRLASRKIFELFRYTPLRDGAFPLSALSQIVEMAVLHGYVTPRQMIEAALDGEDKRNKGLKQTRNYG